MRYSSRWRSWASPSEMALDWHSLPLWPTSGVQKTFMHSLFLQTGNTCPFAMQPPSPHDPSEWPCGHNLVLSGSDSSRHGSSRSPILLGTQVENNQELREASLKHLNSWGGDLGRFHLSKYTQHWDTRKLLKYRELWRAGTWLINTHPASGTMPGTR